MMKVYDRFTAKQEQPDSAVKCPHQRHSRMRLPRELLRKYSIADTLLVEERPDGILLRGTRQDKVSLDQTFAEMAQANENWSDLASAQAIRNCR